MNEINDIINGVKTSFESKHNNRPYFKNTQMLIHNNIIKSNGREFIQISNISRAWAGMVPKEKVSSKPGVFGLISLFLGTYMVISQKTSYRGGSEALFALGTLLIIVGILAIVMYIAATKQEDTYALNLELNSGKYISFISRDESFVNKAYNVISDLVSNNSTDNQVLIDFRDSKINYQGGTVMGDSTVIQGEGNVNVKGKDNTINNTSGNKDSNVTSVLGTVSNSPITQTLDVEETNRELLSELNKLYDYYSKMYPGDKDEIENIQDAIYSIKSSPKKPIDYQLSKLKTSTINMAKDLSLGVLINAISKLAGFM